MSRLAKGRQAETQRPVNKGHFERFKVVTFFLKPDVRKTSERLCLSEHPFGTIKRSMNAGYFLLKGLRKVTGEFALFCLGYNIKSLSFRYVCFIQFSTNHEGLSQPIMKIGYWLRYFFNACFCCRIGLGRIKFDCTLVDLPPFVQRKRFTLEHSILWQSLWLARVAKSVSSRVNLLPSLERSLCL